MANEGSTKPTYSELELKNLAEKARDFVPEPLKCVHCGKEMIQSTAPMASGGIWMDRCKDGEAGHTYSFTLGPIDNPATRFAASANPQAILDLLAELARVQGLLQRLFTFARHEEDCPAWGFHRPTGAYWAEGDEKKCYCGVGKIFKLATFPQSSSLVPQGAESADIGKLDTADKSGKVSRVEELINRTYPSVTLTGKTIKLGSAETGGEKALGTFECPDCGRDFPHNITSHEADEREINYFVDRWFDLYAHQLFSTDAGKKRFAQRTAVAILKRVGATGVEGGWEEKHC